MSSTKTKLIPKFFRDLNAQREAGLGVVPGKDSPICKKCGMCDFGAKTPFMPYAGSTEPLITFVLDSVSKKEDDLGGAALGGTAKFISEQIALTNPDFDQSQIRWTYSTRCAFKRGKKPSNIPAKARWCKNFLVQDFEQHPPKLIVPVGTGALGALTYKSNAGDWAGKVLTYRGWPDDWIVDSKFDAGHPVFGSKPDAKTPVCAVQNPALVYATRNTTVIKRWKKQLKKVVDLAVSGVDVRQYDRPWFNLTSDPEAISRELRWLIDHKGTTVAFDTETTGLKQYATGQKIVLMMFRWEDEEGNPKAIGFPWDYETSPIKPHLARLSPVVLEALYSSKLIGHNLTFDMLFVHGTVAGADIDRLAQAMDSDTWHMLYTVKQQRGSLGLELITYDWCPDMAGYEEEMTLLIDKHPEMQPQEGGHYANCPAEYWDTHLKSYIMGDVETVYNIKQRVEERLARTEGFRIPLANPDKLGSFKYYQTQNREFVYNSIMKPASRMLAKLMGRGAYVDAEELSSQEDLFPKLIKEARESLRASNEKIVLWAEQQEASDPEWEFDLENKSQLKTILFQLLNLPIKRLTKSGQKSFGDDISKVSPEDRYTYAACDKFTLSGLAAEHEEVRPLQEYRKLHKAYTAFIRPLRNIKTPGLDKKDRLSDPHLMPDGCIHASFKITGTGSGRTSCAEPNLQQLSKDGIIKRLYTSRWGADGSIYQGDLSQIELRIMAAFCGDPIMVKAYREGEDLHSITTSRVFNIPYEHFSESYTSFLQNNGKSKEAKELSLCRRVGKVVNFLTSYGGGAFGLQTALANGGIFKTLDECEIIINAFFDSYPSLKKLLGYYKRFILDNGCAVSPFGRVRWFEDAFSDDNKIVNKALRSGCNHLIQSTASDMMLMCLCEIERRMREKELKSVLMLTVHDSLLVDAVRSELNDVHQIVTETLENIPSVLSRFFGGQIDLSIFNIVPFGGSYEVGLSYLDSKVIVGGTAPDWDKLLDEH